MHVLAKISMQLVILAGGYLAMLFPVWAPLAFIAGAVAALATNVVLAKWPEEKPLYLEPLKRPAPLTVYAVRLTTVLVYVPVLLLGVFLFVAHLFPGASSYVMGLGLCGLVTGWLKAPKDVQEQNRWLGAMRGQLTV